MRVALVLSVLGVGLGLLVALGRWSSPSRPPPGSSTAEPAREPAPDGGPSGTSALWKEVESLRRSRAELEAEVAWLRSELERLDAVQRSGVAATPDAAEPTSAEPSEPEGEAVAAEPPRPRPAPPRRQGFDRATLADLGVSADEAARLEDRFQEHELDELYLRDQAMREHWFGRPRYLAALRRLNGDLREEVGDDDYDLMLFGAGRPNRVQLATILHNSPAANAGLREGDVVLRYDGRAIFNGSDLQRATSRAEAGAPVPVDVVRDGQEARLYVPGGPLGAHLQPLRRVPEPR